MEDDIKYYRCFLRKLLGAVREEFGYFREVFVPGRAAFILLRDEEPDKLRVAHLAFLLRAPPATTATTPSTTQASPLPGLQTMSPWQVVYEYSSRSNFCHFCCCQGVMTRVKNMCGDHDQWQSIYARRKVCMNFTECWRGFGMNELETWKLKKEPWFL